VIVQFTFGAGAFATITGGRKAENRRKIVAVIHISIQEKIVLSRRVRAVPEYSVQFDDMIFKTRWYHI